MAYGTALHFQASFSSVSYFGASFTPVLRSRLSITSSPTWQLQNILLRSPSLQSRTPKMLPTLQPRDYSEKPSGFFHLYSHRKYLGFISDVEDTNRVYLLTHPISRSEIEQLFTRTVTALHREWCSDIKKGVDCRCGEGTRSWTRRWIW